MIVGEDLQLGIEVEVQEDETSEGGGGVARRHRLETVVDLLPVTSADATVEHDLAIAIANVSGRSTVLVSIVVAVEVKTLRNDRLTDSEEMGTKTANEPLDEDLEDGCRDQSVEESNGGVVDVPEGASTDLDD